MDYGGWLDTVWFGVHPDATYGIDYLLGEEEQPPLPPPGAFDVRFVNIPGRTELGLGVKLDLRGYINQAQVDTYQVQYQTSGGYPVTLSLPSGLNVYVRSMQLINPRNSQVVCDMLTTTSVVITDPSVNRLFIVTTGPGGQLPWLSVEPLSGTVFPIDTWHITVSARSQGILQGTHHALLMVHSNDPANPSVSVPVTVTIVPPVIVVFPDSLGFALKEGDSTTAQVKVSNAGSGNLRYSVSERSFITDLSYATRNLWAYAAMRGNAPTLFSIGNR